MNKYKMIYISGSGKENDGGIWKMRETNKFYIFEIIKKPFFDTYDKLKCRKDNSNKHTIKVWGDGKFTVYPNMNGTPHIFKPLNKNNE